MSQSTDSTLPALPAIRSVGDKSDCGLVLIVDAREQCPLVFKNLPSKAGTLTSGDYSFEGGQELFSIERKTVADLVACCSGERERFERELHRLRGYRFARLLIVGSEAEISTHRYRSGMNPKAVLHTVRAFEARYIPVVFEPSKDKAAELVERWAYWSAREIIKAANSLSTGTKNAEPGEPAA